ncbi:ATP-binding protein [Terricaulis sp.]|uniref:ATP-binding protein n=1 Tax=Terricaulis sp. TaxID=2768686 RepID=UPI003783B299
MTPLRFPHSWLRSPAPVVIVAALLLVAGIIGTSVAESDFRTQRVEQARAHARVLASSVSGALAFQDSAEGAQAVAATAAAPDVGAIGVYNTQGELFVSRNAAADAPPARAPRADTAYFRNGYAIASERVMQSGARLGTVYVSVRPAPGVARWLRYLGVSLLLLMSALVLAIVAAAQRGQNLANAELERRAAELARTNIQLSKEVQERQKAQTALGQAQKMEAIGQLTGGIAHDFNNLLMVISSGLRLLESRDDESKRAAIVASMRQAVERGASVTKQLLAFSRRQKLSPEVMLVQERLAALRPLLERSLREDIVLRFDFRGEDIAVKVDGGQFDLAILNLAVNARDAMPKGGELVIGVERQHASAERVAAIAVADTGTGMPPEVKARAFDPFFSTKGVGKGTGLGLSQVYGFALQSGGGCEIESEPGRGAIITLKLPLTDESPPPPSVKIADETKGAGAVLMVEDDESVGAMVGEMLADLGYQVVRVTSAQDALIKLADAAASVDVVFSDIIMPGGMSGIDLAREVRRRRPHLPILLTTGYGGIEELDAHEFPVLRKPYERHELSAALARAMAHEPGS